MSYSASNELSGVKRYKKGRSFADTLFGKLRYGKDLRTDEWVAIKENRRWFAQNKISIKGEPVPEDLFREIEIHKYLMSQNDLPIHILKLLDVVQDDVFIYLVLELIDGGDFFAFIQNGHQKLKSQMDQEPMNGLTTKGIVNSSDSNTMDVDMEMENKKEKVKNSNSNNVHVTKTKKRLSAIEEWELKIRQIFKDLVSCVLWMHSKRVCHLDISLENALITKSGVVKIIDFGLAQRFLSKRELKEMNDANEDMDSSELKQQKDRETEEEFLFNKKCGKSRCMAPEVYHCKKYDARKADTWAVGVMLFMMLLGIPPWSVPHESEMIFRMISAGKIRDVIVFNKKRKLVSNEALDLLIRFFKCEEERILLHDVMSHPFLANITSS